MSAQVDPERSEWDVIVIGGGAAGENAAQYATQFSGLQAVIVEGGLLGGECSYWACMPSKALLRPVEVLDTARNLPGMAALVGTDGLDVDAVLARRDEVVHHLDDESQIQWALGVGIDVIRGHARLQGERTVAVGVDDGSTRVITARHAVVLATGSTASVPSIPGLAAAAPWTSRDVTNIHEIPRRILVIGGGVVACESATWLSGLGVEEVTIVEGGPRLLGRTEPFAGELVADSLRARGLTVALETRVESVGERELTPAPVGEPAGPGGRVGRSRGGQVTVRLSGGTSVIVDEIVVAAGRTPNTADVGIESVGLRHADLPHGYLTVDDQLRVRGVDDDWLYAVGDLDGRALLTHMGKYQGRIAGKVIAARAAGTTLDTGSYSPHDAAAGHAAVPQVTFTDPEVGSAGMTEEQARAAGMDVETAEYDMAALAGTYVLRDNYRGRAKLVLDRATDTLVGVTFVGTGVAELVHSATTAIVAKTPVRALWHVVPSYPTASEIWLRLLETLQQQRQSA